jgi:nitrate/nitrite-specific signal transduction histidine kinase
MAEDLSAIYADLEARVTEKTHDLERRNRTLELLYSATKRLSESSLSPEALAAVIHDIEHLLGAKSGTICLGQPGDRQAYRYASTSQYDNLIQDDLERDCARCRGCSNHSATVAVSVSASAPTAPYPFYPASGIAPLKSLEEPLIHEYLQPDRTHQSAQGS